jgi:phage-related protein
MIKLMYPGSVQNRTNFTYSIEDAVPGATWSADVYQNGVVVAQYAGTVGADGRAENSTAQLVEGSYVFEFTFSTGEFFSVPVQSLAEATFIWMPDYSVQVSKKPNVRETKFGDGYVQAAPAGLNHNPQSWDLSFSNLTDIESMQIMLFLDSMGGHKSFVWRNPDGRKLRFRCTDYAKTYTEEDNNSVRAKFDQSFI